uniref:DUF2254 domain-containing protein n=1 Tax=Heligmosomoides polygyrus TaxID=6339 RepID=A0A183GCP7_HELPZ
LTIFATIVQFMVDRVAPREDIARLLTETMSSVELAINRLAIWAREGHRDAEKVVNHINDTLAMIGLVFTKITTPVKREMSRAVCQLSLLGLADPTEADNLYTRLMGVVSDVINNAMQVEDKAGAAIPVAY